MVFAGSLPPGMPPEAFARLIGLCQDRGARVAVDSSGPGLEAVRPVRGLWLIKPNREELAELRTRTLSTAAATGLRTRRATMPSGTDADLRAAALPLLDRADHVAVTLGADGACLFTREGSWRARLHGARLARSSRPSAPATPFWPASSTAMPPAPLLPDCLRYAVACGTASTYQVRAGKVDPEDVRTCLKGVECREGEGTRRSQASASATSGTDQLGLRARMRSHTRAAPIRSRKAMVVKSGP